MYLKYDVFKLIKIDYEYYKFKYSNNFFKMLQLQNKFWRMNICFNETVSKYKVMWRHVSERLLSKGKYI